MIPREAPNPKHRFEQMLDRLVKDVKALKQPRPLTLDDQGRLRLGDAYLIFETDPTDQSIVVSAQNAVTRGPTVRLAVLT
jgi:hypothetical protein